MLLIGHLWQEVDKSLVEVSWIVNGDSRRQHIRIIHSSTVVRTGVEEIVEECKIGLQVAS